MNKKEAMYLLEISGEFTKKDLRKAYSKAVKRNHPDLGGSNIKMSQINLAYEYLQYFSLEDSNDTYINQNAIYRNDILNKFKSEILTSILPSFKCEEFIIQFGFVLDNQQSISEMERSYYYYNSLVYDEILKIINKNYRLNLIVKPINNPSYSDYCKKISEEIIKVYIIKLQRIAELIDWETGYEEHKECIEQNQSNIIFYELKRGYEEFKSKIEQNEIEAIEKIERCPFDYTNSIAYDNILDEFNKKSKKNLKEFYAQVLPIMEKELVKSESEKNYELNINNNYYKYNYY